MDENKNFQEENQDILNDDLNEEVMQESVASTEQENNVEQPFEEEPGQDVQTIENEYQEKIHIDTTKPTMDSAGSTVVFEGEEYKNNVEDKTFDSFPSQIQNDVYPEKNEPDFSVPQKNTTNNNYENNFDRPGDAFKQHNRVANTSNNPGGYYDYRDNWQPSPNYPSPNHPYQSTGKTQIKRKSKSNTVLISLMCCLLVAFTVIGGFSAYTLLRNNSTDTNATLMEGNRESVSLDTVRVDTSKEMTAAEVYAANVESTVGITTSIVSTNYFGYKTKSAVSGSGFIISDSGYIVTNYHVVENGNQIFVTTYDNTQYEAKLVGRDENNDLAVIKIDGKNLKPVILGDSEKMHVGDNVIAIGNPLGELTFSLTKGAISAMNRSVTVENIPMTLLQTDCAINSGNSGGALFNMYGEVIGITNAKYGGSGSAAVDNIAFAIPISTVKNTINSIIETGQIEKTYIGIQGKTYTNALTADRNSDIIQGVQIMSVEAYSPAADANIQTGDIVTAINGTKVTSMEKLKATVAAGKDGDVLTLTIIRQGQTTEAKVVLKSKKESALPTTNSNQDLQEQQEINPNDNSDDFINGFEDFMKPHT